MKKKSLCLLLLLIFLPIPFWIKQNYFAWRVCADPDFRDRNHLEYVSSITAYYLSERELVVLKRCALQGNRKAANELKLYYQKIKEDSHEAMYWSRFCD